MTKPLRRSLLNEEIAVEARRIAHAYTHTCRGAELPGNCEYHTNQLFQEIVELAIGVKLAREQPPARREPAPDFALTGLSSDA